MARIFDTDGITLLSGAGFEADLYWAVGTVADSTLLVALNAPAPFNTGAEAGYFTGGQRIIPGVDAGWIITAQVRAWDTAGGSFNSWVVAKNGGGATGESVLFQVTLNGPPSTPAYMTGLNGHGFSLLYFPQDFTYVAANGTITITGYKGLNPSVTIPSSISGLTVTSIGDLAFANNGLVTNLVIGSGITNIGQYAFSPCPELQAITVDPPNPVYSSRDGVLFDRNQTLLIRYPAARPGSYSVPDTVIAFSGGAFQYCRNLTDISLGNGVTNIGDSAFQFCESLTNATIPNTVVSIGNGAFQFCRSLTCATIPDSVVGVGGGAFQFCYSLANITLGDGLTNIPDFLFSSCSNLTSVTVPQGVLSINSSAFLNCASLTNVSIPDTVNLVAEDAFAYSGLTSITIPNSVTNLGFEPFFEPFLYCLKLQSITVGPLNSIYSSSDGVLFDKSGASLLRCPRAKQGNYTIPLGVTNLGYKSFAGCAYLTSVAIPSTVTSIGWVFESCSGLTNVIIPNGVVMIGGGSFAGCSSLPNLVMPDSVAYIGPWAFELCPGLTNITFGAGLTNIDYDAFSGCSSLLNVAIPDGVLRIGSGAFQGCANLTNFTIPKTVTLIENDGFLGCSRLPANVVDPLNLAYTTSDGALLDKNQTTLIRCPEGKTGNYSIPNGVTNILEFAFRNCINLTNVTIPKTVSTIQDWGFLDCSELTSVYFKGNAPNAGIEIFDGDTNVTCYYLPGTGGWGTTYVGSPTRVWAPVILTGDGSFGVKNNVFGFTMSWASGMNLVVEASQDLAHPVWAPLATNLFANDSSYFADPAWTNSATRLYRLRWQ
jgi:hypothetical protein